MSQVTMSVRMDEDVKRLFDAYCAEMGMNASVAVNIFAKAVIRERCIPFTVGVSADPFYDPINQKVLHASIEQLDAGRGHRHELLEDDDE